MYDKIFEKDNDAKNYFQKIDFNSTIEEIRDLLNNAALLKMPAPSSDIINLDQFNVILEKLTIYLAFLMLRMQELLLITLKQH